jgi:hypothetical protein
MHLTLLFLDYMKSPGAIPRLLRALLEITFLAVRSFRGVHSPVHSFSSIYIKYI